MASFRGLAIEHVESAAGRVCCLDAGIDPQLKPLVLSRHLEYLEGSIRSEISRLRD